MSGLRELGGPLNPGDGRSMSPSEIDQYYFINIDNPSVSATYTAQGTTTGTTPAALVITNAIGEWPRNPFYNTTGGTTGGTYVANWIDQFGYPVTETVSFGSTTSNQTKFGTVIAAKFVSGTFFPNTSIAGTYNIGYGTTSNGGSQSNWFGLYTKVEGTVEVKHIRWNNNGTVTGLNKGTAIGTLVGYNNNGSLPSNAFQGTSGVAIGDTYTVVVRPTFDNLFKNKLTNL